jgi:hypothetical protein
VELYKLNAVEQQMSDDMEWTMTAPEVQQHHDQLVAVYKKRVVGVGLDSMPMVRQAAAELDCY